MSGEDAAQNPHACPRCKLALERGTLSQTPIQACRACKGALVAQGELARLLDELSGPLMRSLDPDAKLEAATDAGARIDCPKCRRRMDRDDYCAAGLVFFDRCTSCALLWFDADELGATSLMWARMNTRPAREEAIRREASDAYLLLHRNLPVDRVLLRSAVWTLLRLL